MPEGIDATVRGERRVEPKPARGVKIAVGVFSGIVALLALAVWALIKAVSS